MSRKLLTYSLCVSFAAMGCHAPAGEREAELEQAVVDGQDSGPEDNAVVKIESIDSAGTIGNCSATLVAPNLLVTARHCVTNMGPGTFTCDADGNLVAGPGGGTGILNDPTKVAVKSGSTVGKALAHGTQIFAAETQTICLNDFALVLLDTKLDQSPYNLPIAPIRLYSGTEIGEQVRMVGYGPAYVGALTGKQRTTRSGLIVSKVGRSEYRPVGDAIPPRMFTIDGTAGCKGDSGGPTLSDSNAVTGVFSQFIGDCYLPTTINYFAETAPFRDDVILPAFKAAGYEPWLENNSEPGLYGTGGRASTGAGGSGGASTAIVGSGGATSTIATSAASGGAAETGGAAVDVGGAQALGGAQAQTGGSSAEVVVYDRGPSNGGSCGCRVAGARGYGLGVIAAMAMLLGARRRRARGNAT